MRILIPVLLILALAQGTPALAADVTGGWDFAVETGMGTANPVFVFKQEGQKLTGTYTGVFGEAILEGTVEENQIRFVLKVKYEDADIVVTYSGAIDGDSMKGTVTFGDLGDATWTARRRKPPQ
ncbi:MAG: hypothetical protein ACR2L2_10700 [Acidobacteriota bacterium]